MNFFDVLKQLLDVIRDKKPHALVITGAGRHFSAGANIDELLTMVDQERMLDHHKTFLGFENLELPVISAIQGVCLGAAFELTLFSHFRLCTKDAVLGMPESTFNLMPGLGGTGKLANIAGRAKAIELVMCGSTFSAADALKFGLVDAVVEKKALLPMAIQFATSLPPGKLIADRIVYIQKYLKPLMANA